MLLIASGNCQLKLLDRQGKQWAETIRGRRIVCAKNKFIVFSRWSVSDRFVKHKRAHGRREQMLLESIDQNGVSFLLRRRVRFQIVCDNKSKQHFFQDITSLEYGRFQSNHKMHKLSAKSDQNKKRDRKASNPDDVRLFGGRKIDCGGLWRRIDSGVEKWDYFCEFYCWNIHAYIAIFLIFKNKFR